MFYLQNPNYHRHSTPLTPPSQPSPAPPAPIGSLADGLQDEEAVRNIDVDAVRRGWCRQVEIGTIIVVESAI